MARARKPKKPIVYSEHYDYASGPGMMSYGSNTSSTMFPRNFDAELEHIAHRVEENLRELGYPDVGSDMERFASDSIRFRREVLRSLPAWRPLFDLKRTLDFISEYRKRGEAWEPLAFDLGLQMQRARAADIFSAARTARGKRSGKTRQDALAPLIESRIISCQSRQREDCFQKAVIKRGLRRMRRSVLRARSSSSQ